MNRFKPGLALFSAVAFLAAAGIALAQQQRMDQYQKTLEGSLNSQLGAMSAASDVKEGAGALKEKLGGGGGGGGRGEKMAAKVNINNSDRGDAKDVEIVLAMPIQQFNEYAPTAFCEAVATPHGFPTNYVYVRNSNTGKTGHVAFKDVESLGGQYKSGPKQKTNAEAEMARKIVWH
jgi:hypothetical protein